MTNSKEIKDRSNSLYENGKLEFAFTTLSSLPVAELWIYLTDNKKLFWLKSNDVTIQSFVWNAISKTNFLIPILSSDQCEDFLFKYFSNGYKHCPDLITQIPSEFSVKAIVAIRTTQFYLRVENKDVLNNVRINPVDEKHRIFWLHISDEEKSLWNAVIESHTSLAEIPVDELLVRITLSLEKRRFDDSSSTMIHHLADVYNLMMEIILSKKSKIDFSNIKLKGMASTFAICLVSKTRPSFQENIEKFISCCEKWVILRKGVLDHYSFDLNYDLKFQNWAIGTTTSEEHFYNSRLDGMRYLLNMWHYQMDAEVVVEELVKKGKMNIPPGKDKMHDELNLIMAQVKTSMRLLLLDLELDKVRNTSNKNEVDTESWLGSVVPHAFNRKISYEDRMVSLFSDTKSWEEAWKKYLVNYAGKSEFTFPFEYYEREEHVNFLQRPAPYLSRESISVFLDLISYKGNQVLDRFNLRFDVWATPFILSGDKFFCPMMFFANNNWFYATAQAAMNYQKFRSPDYNETKAMEENLGLTFGSKVKWLVRNVTQKEANILDGDVDLILVDGNDVLIIQLKRTYFRLNLKDMRNEEENSDRKAASQLNKAFEHLSKETPFNDVGKPSMKWIVSTSFERIGEYIDGCLKVNYLELLRALRSGSFDTIDDLKTHLTVNSEIKRFVDFVESEPLSQIEPIVQEVIGSLGVFRASDIFLPIITSDSSDHAAYVRKFNDAYKLYEAKQFVKAIEIWMECANISTEDDELWIAIAIAYADIKDFLNAERHFMKALEINPNNPSTLHDLSISQIKAGKCFDALETLIKINGMYPIMVPTRYELKALWKEAITSGKLTEEQILDINKKLKQIGFD